MIEIPDKAVANHFSPAGRRWRRYELSARLFHRPMAVIPLLNVLLLILLFIIFHSAFVLKPGINIQLPAGAFQEGAFYNSRVVILTQEGLVFYNDERLPLEALAAAFRADKAENGAFQLTLEADLRVPYDSIMRVLNMAAAAGVSNIYLAVRPTFGEEIMP